MLLIWSYIKDVNIMYDKRMKNKSPQIIDFRFKVTLIVPQTDIWSSVCFSTAVQCWRSRLWFHVTPPTQSAPWSSESVTALRQINFIHLKCYSAPSAGIDLHCTRPTTTTPTNNNSNKLVVDVIKHILNREIRFQKYKQIVNIYLRS